MHKTMQLLKVILNNYSYNENYNFTRLFKGTHSQYIKQKVIEKVIRKHSIFH